MTKLENMTLKELVTYNTNQYKLSNYGRPWMSTKAEKAYKNFSESKKILKSIRNLTNPLIDNYIWNYKTSSILTNIFKIIDIQNMLENKTIDNGEARRLIQNNLEL